MGDPSGLLDTSLRDVRANVLYPRLDLRSLRSLALSNSCLALELRSVLSRLYAEEVSGEYLDVNVPAFRAPSEIVSVRVVLDGGAASGKVLFCRTAAGEARGDAASLVVTKRLGTVRRDGGSTFACRFVLEAVQRHPEETETSVDSVDVAARIVVSVGRKRGLAGGPLLRISPATMTFESVWGTYELERSSTREEGSLADALLAKELANVRLERWKEPSNLSSSY